MVDFHVSETVIVAGDEQDDMPLQNAVWLAEDLGILPPPIPSPYVTALAELSLGRVFGTSAALAELSTPERIVDVVSTSGWPEPGLVFGFAPIGASSGLWFYTLTSDSLLIHVSLRVLPPHHPEAPFRLVEINRAHQAIEGYLADDINFHRAIKQPVDDTTTSRSLVFFSDDAGSASELHAAWTAAAGLQAFVPRGEIFELPVPLEGAPAEDVVIFR